MIKRLMLLSLLINLASFAQTFSTSSSVSISNNPSFDVSYPIIVSGLPTTINSNFGIGELCFNINHTNVEDLIIQLQSPDGTTILIGNKLGGDGDNFINTCLTQNGSNGNLTTGEAPFTGFWIPIESLNLLNNGQNPNGTWNLKMKNAVQSDTGIITNCSITFSANPAIDKPLEPVTITPKKAFDYYDGVGVNIHLRFGSTVYYNQFNSIIYPRLRELGVKNVRDGLPYEAFLNKGDETLIKNRFIQLYETLGIKTCYLLDSSKIIDNVDLLNKAAYLSVFENSEPLRNTVKYIEGFNEPDLTIYGLYPVDWASYTHTIQKSMWNRARSTNSLTKFPIIAPSLVTYWSIPSKPGMVSSISPHISNFFDYANFHSYDTGAHDTSSFPGHYYDSGADRFDTVQQKKPFVITEIGYQNAIGWNMPTSSNYAPNRYHYLSELASAKYYSVLFMELFSRGAKTIYTYELIDQDTSNQNSAEMNFGLLHTDGSTKPAFNVIKNTLSLFQDTVTNFTPADITFNLSGSTTGIKYAVYQKSNGNYLIGIWQDKTRGVCYDFATLTDLASINQNVQFTFPSKFTQANVYQPLVSNTPIKTYFNNDAININIPDNLIVLELINDVISAENSFIIYPNPTSDFITVQLNIAEKEEIKIYNPLGQLVKKVEVSNNDKIDVSELLDGVYFIRLNKKDSPTLKFIKL